MYYDEVQELACVITGLDYDQIVNEEREPEIEDALFNKFEISLDQLQRIAEALLELTPIIESELTGALYHAFGVLDEDTDRWRAICKEKC
jgi:hypothetical protein